jgi:hypothetical protein
VASRRRRDGADLGPGTGAQVGEALTGHTGTVYEVCTLPGGDATGHPDGRGVQLCGPPDPRVGIVEDREQLGEGLGGRR